MAHSQARRFLYVSDISWLIRDHSWSSVLNDPVFKTSKIKHACLVCHPCGRWLNANIAKVRVFNFMI